MGALSLSSKEELGNGQTFPGVCIPFTSALFPSRGPDGPLPNSPLPWLSLHSPVLLADVSDGQDILEDPSYVSWLQPNGASDIT